MFQSKVWKLQFQHITMSLSTQLWWTNGICFKAGGLYLFVLGILKLTNNFQIHYKHPQSQIVGGFELVKLSLLS